MFDFIKKSKKIEIKEPRMYLILREDLAYKYIQGAHALANFSFRYPLFFEEWNNKYLICLSVFNGLYLNELRYTLLEDGIEFVPFFEPDLSSSLPTALCLYDDGKHNYEKYLKDLPLATK